MAQRVYEGMFLLDANKYSRDPSGVAGRIGEMIEKCGGEVLVSRLWAEQKLAYQIGNHRKGAYWLVYFRMESMRNGELNRASQLNHEVLRHLVLSVDDRLVDTLVRHAQGNATAEPPAEKPATKSAGADASEAKAESTETATAAASE